KDPAATRIEGRADRADLSTLRADSRHEEQPIRREGAEARGLRGIGRADDEAAPTRRECRDALLDDALIDRPAVHQEVLDIPRAGIARAREHERVALL